MGIKTNGSTRWVLLIGNLAFKFPSLFSWKNFLWGLLANMQEIEFSRMKWEKLCPVLFYIPGGFLVVMPKAKVLKCGEVSTDTLKDFCIVNENYHIPAELKHDSFGYVNEKLVAIDYGS